METMRESAEIRPYESLAPPGSSDIGSPNESLAKVIPLQTGYFRVYLGQSCAVVHVEESSKTAWDNRCKTLPNTND